MIEESTRDYVPADGSTVFEIADAQNIPLHLLLAINRLRLDEPLPERIKLPEFQFPRVVPKATIVELDKRKGKLVAVANCIVFVSLETNDVISLSSARINKTFLRQGSRRNCVEFVVDWKQPGNPRLQQLVFSGPVELAAFHFCVRNADLPNIISSDLIFVLARRGSWNRVEDADSRSRVIVVARTGEDRILGIIRDGGYALFAFSQLGLSIFRIRPEFRVEFRVGPSFVQASVEGEMVLNIVDGRGLARAFPSGGVTHPLSSRPFEVVEFELWQPSGAEACADDVRSF